MLFLSHPLLLHLYPLPILACFIISFRHWLQTRGYRVFVVYLGLCGLSILTSTAIKAWMPNSARASLIGAICIPAFYGLLYVCVEAVRGLRAPYRGLAQQRRPPKLRRLIGGAVGGCVGGITGSSLGALFGLAVFLLAPLLTLNLDLGWQMSQAVQRSMEWTTALFGLLGLLLGLLAGWGRLNFKQIGDRVLIALTIQSFLIAAGIRRLLGRCSR